MIKKLFGETEEMQFNYLQPRVVILGIGVVILLVGALLNAVGLSFGSSIGGLGGGICALMAFVFGWAIMKGIFGIASIGALFSGNVVIGIAIFVLFLMIGYFGGFIVAFIGICRFLVLLKKRK